VSSDVGRVRRRVYDLTADQQRMLRIGAGQSLGPEPGRRKKQVTDGMGRLHRGDDIQVCEARHVSRTEYLGVLDAPARFSNRALADGNGCQRPLAERSRSASALGRKSRRRGAVGSARRQTVGTTGQPRGKSCRQSEVVSSRAGHCAAPATSSACERSASVGGGSSRSTEVHGIVDQHARGLTGGVFENSAAEAVGRPSGAGVFRSIPARLSAR
jgi:hypothetical protein